MHVSFQFSFVDINSEAIVYCFSKLNYAKIRICIYCTPRTLENKNEFYVEWLEVECIYVMQKYKHNQIYMSLVIFW